MTLKLPITSDAKETLKRWAAELRKLVFLVPADFVGKPGWSPTGLSSLTSSLGAGALVFANVQAVDADYWLPTGGDICNVSAVIKFDITSGTEPFIYVPLPIAPKLTTAGQYIFAYTLWGSATAQRRVVPATVYDKGLIVPRQEDSAVNQWATQTNNYIIVSGHYKINR
jgi:hypothetical protein